ncbi:unnamed protein product (macronuclear) [Paramecium tetraurelia]|uniref:Uncharacterized protein n=1 Tax=Paramecium tetraurelia TaxID=5888 RepID=A0E362_PARTE|nr:uncharacterized protein GSPATT00022902001 [Paramecium tetraurelia]CAK89729.1 unnamed protein product [Paramecium tetraurelia]|eukprot:XP_001457126.1 hypothetical protein (macronuclear) [Paramecium tetraurelia strain d4-2]
MNKTKNNHRRSQSNNDFQQIMCSKIAGLVEQNSHKNLLKNQSFGNMLFQIPEQTDIGSSTEQSHHSEKKSCITDNLLSNKKNYSQDQKENLINSNSCNNIISSIQYMIKSSHPIKEIAQKTLNNESQSKKKQLSFTNELQKKNSQILHQQNKIDISSSLTPDRKKMDNNNSKQNSHKQKSAQQQIDGQEKSKIELSNFLLNNLLKVDQKKKTNVEQQDSFRRIEFQMNEIQKDISKIKKRQDELDLFNRNIQNQLFDFISESRKYQDYGYQSLQKLEQLEQITRRNEESIKMLKQKLLNNDNQQITTKQHENNINFGNISSYKQELDIQKKMSDFKYIKYN